MQRAHSEGPPSESTVNLGPTWQHNLEAGRSPTQVSTCRYHWGMNLIQKLQFKSFQTFQNQNSSPSRRNNESKLKSQNKARPKQHVLKILCFTMKFVRLHPSNYKVWIHLTRVIQILILHECVLPERKSGRAHHRASSCTLVMIPKQAIYQSQMSDDTENFRKAPGRPRPKGKGGY